MNVVCTFLVYYPAKLSELLTQLTNVGFSILWFNSLVLYRTVVPLPTSTSPFTWTSVIFRSPIYWKSRSQYLYPNYDVTVDSPFLLIVHRVTFSSFSPLRLHFNFAKFLFYSQLFACLFTPRLGFFSGQFVAKFFLFFFWSNFFREKTTIIAVCSGLFCSRHTSRVQ